MYRLRVELTELVGRLDPVPPTDAFLARFDALVTRGAGIITSGTPHEFTQFNLEVFHVPLGLANHALP